MGKAIKITLAIVVGIFLLLAAALGVAAAIFDPNDHRDRIAAEVEALTGRSFSIDGDIELRIFPWLAVSIEQMQLGNAEGFGDDPFARVERAAVGIRLLPLLLRREVVVDDVTLNGLALELAVDAQGRNNWDDLAEALQAAEEEAETAPTDDKPAEDRPPAIRDLDIAGFSLRDARLRYRDGQAGVSHVVENVNLSTGRVRLGEPVMVNLEALYRGGEPELSAELRFSGVADAQLATATYKLQQISLNVIARGDGIPNSQQSLSLTGNAEFNANDGHLSFPDGRLQAAGITANLTLEGRGLGGDRPEFDGSLKTREFSPRAVADTLAIEIPEMNDRTVLRKARIETRFEANPQRARIPQLEAVLDDTTVTGSLTISDFATQRIEFALRADHFDVDRYTPKETAAATAAGTAPATGGNINDIRIPVEMLELINGKGTIALDELRAQGLRFQDVLLTIDAPRSRPKTQQLQARLYGGNIVLSNRVEPADRPRYSTQFRVESVAAGDLLRDFLGRDLAEGVANLSVDLNSRGDTVGDIRKALNGTITARLSDGAVKGFNIAQTLRNAKARFSGEAAADDGPAQTDFASLVASARITNGVLEIENLDGRNPLLRLLAGGSVNLVDETLDVLARPNVVRDLSGQQGRGLEELAGLEIPIRVRGSWAEPSVRIDLETVLREQAVGRVREAVAPHEDEVRERLRKEEERLGRQLEERVGEGAGDALRSLFGGRSSRRDEPREQKQDETKPAEEADKPENKDAEGANDGGNDDAS